MRIIDHPSPNFDARGRSIDLIILHYTGMRTGAEALDRLCDVEARVSAHYLVEEDGAVYALVAEEDRAWHAGVASWRGETDINARSVGIEIVNPGHEWGYRAFPAHQVEAVTALVADIQKRHGIDARGVLGHSDVAPARKEDPGELFPWGRLASEALAIGPFEGEGDAQIPVEAALAALREIGYDAPNGAHAAALLAFQRRFCPGSLGKGFEPITKSALLFVRDQFLRT